MAARDFGDQLAALVAEEVTQARLNPARQAAAVELLASSLGFAVAMASRGDRLTLDTLMEGATAYAHTAAVERAHVARVVDQLTRQILWGE
jgi:hypothetical protein